MFDVNAEEVLSVFRERGELTLAELKVSVIKKRLGYNEFTAEALHLAAYLGYPITSVLSQLRTEGLVTFNENRKFQLT